MEQINKTLFTNEYNNIKAPSKLKQNVFRSIEYLDIAKVLLELFVVMPIVVIHGMVEDNSRQTN
ncbi:MAG: hypothetical protein U9N04_05095 [Patescibacteria group bacterium]|nr:hypothetical protein [Patescibacteria group bacterium]